MVLPEVSMPNGYGQDEMSRTFWVWTNVSMDILDRTKCPAKTETIKSEQLIATRKQHTNKVAKLQKITE